MSHTHHPGGSWKDREQDNAQLTMAAGIAAADTIVRTIRGFESVQGAEHKKATLLNQMAHEMGNIFPQDMEGHPTLAEHAHNSQRPPETLGEMKKTLNRLVNRLSNDIYMQDMCRAATQAAVEAAREAMAGKTKGKH